MTQKPRGTLRDWIYPPKIRETDPVYSRFFRDDHRLTLMLKSMMLGG